MVATKIATNCVPWSDQSCHPDQDLLEHFRISGVSVFNTAAMLTPCIESLQFAFRAKLGCHAQTPNDDVELPTDFMMDVSTGTHYPMGERVEHLFGQIPRFQNS